MTDLLVDNLFWVFNLCEGLLWIGIALGIAIRFCRTRQNPDLMLAGSLLFLAFGVSDFVEIQTGGWYKPWWLLLWKASCLVGFGVVYALFRRRGEEVASAGNADVGNGEEDHESTKGRKHERE